MISLRRLLASLLPLAVFRVVLPAQAAMPPDLAAAVQQLQAQHSYAWEVIDGDPGPVEQNIQTVRGIIPAVEHSALPHVKGRLSSNGEMLIERDWPDGLALQTFVGADGTMVTKTPEGWMSHQEILEAIADERTRPSGALTSRLQWLLRAEAVDARRPTDDLAPFVNGNGLFEMSSNTFTCTLPIQVGGPATAGKDNSQTVGQATVMIHLDAGMLRDYELKTEIKRRITSARIAVIDHRDSIVVLSYLPVGRISVPDEVRVKAKAASSNSVR